MKPIGIIEPVQTDPSIEGTRLALQILELFQGLDKSVKRAAMRSLSVQLGGEFTLKSEIKQENANAIARSYSSRVPEPSHVRGKAVKSKTKTQPAEWKKNREWTNLQSEKSKRLSELKLINPDNKTETAIAARSSWKSLLKSEKDLRIKLRM